MNKTLKDYEGYEGVDASLDISLFEYGLIWKQAEEKDTYQFVYSSPHDASAYCWSTLSKSDLESMFDSWAEQSAIESYTGIPFGEWIEDFPRNVYDMVSYYGTMNIFGNSYYSFIIEEE